MMLGGNYTRMFRAIFNKSWRQHPTKHQLYGHLPSFTKTIQVRRTRHAGQCWRSRDDLISNVLLWTPTYHQAEAGRPARTYIQQLCKDTGCSPEDLPEAMNDREKWRERVKDIRARSTTWWWWWWWYNVVSLPTIVVGDPKAPFSKATTKCRWGRYSFPWIYSIYNWSIPDNAECYGDIKYHFLSLWNDSTCYWTPASRTIGEYPTIVIYV